MHDRSGFKPRLSRALEQPPPEIQVRGPSEAQREMGNAGVTHGAKPVVPSGDLDTLEATSPAAFIRVQDPSNILPKGSEAIEYDAGMPARPQKDPSLTH